MARKRYQPPKTGGMSTDSKTSEKEELVKARALKRAERVEARRVDAEKHKEFVRSTHLLHFRLRVKHISRTCSRCREMRTFARRSTTRLSRNTKWQSRLTVLIPRTSRTWL